MDSINPSLPAPQPPSLSPAPLPYWSGGPPLVPRVWTTFLAFGVALLALLGIQLAIVPYVWLHNKPATLPQFREALEHLILRRTFLVSLLISNQAMIGLVVAGATWLSPIPARRRLRLGPSNLSPVGYLVAIVGSVAIGYGFEALIALIHVKPTDNLKMIGDLIQNLTLPQILAGVAVIGVLPGIFEELLFRGYIQTRLEEGWGRWSGILITAPLFGIMHLDPMQSPFAYVFGIYLGYVASKAGSIRPTMICHMVNNGLQVFLAWLSHRLIAHGPAAAKLEEPPRAAALVMLAVCCTIIVLSALYLKYAVKSPSPSTS